MIFLDTGFLFALVYADDVRYIQEMLGHERLDTTQVNTQVSIRALKAIHNATHPAARLRKRDGAEDITEAILRVRPADPDLAQP